MTSRENDLFFVRSATDGSKNSKRLSKYGGKFKRMQYKQNIPRWIGKSANGEHARSKRCSSSPGGGIKKSHRNHGLA